jgi:putative Mg2+ transporter-C (MgtC) family protein
LYYDPAELTLFIPLVIATLFGSLIGLEREMRHKAAGVGTNILICVGACVFAIISSRVDPYSPSRIASNILTGVGFIGAGLILKESDGVVHGVTTAAGIWMAAAIGLAIGFDYYLLAAFATIVAIFAPRFPGWAHHKDQNKKVD